MSERPSFAHRGGWWVAAQVPVLLVAALLAPLTAHTLGGFDRSGRYLGVLFVLLGIGAAGAGLATLGRSLTPFPRPRGDAALVTRGVYAYIRHPIYAGLIAMSLGWAFVWSSAAGVLYGLLVAVFFDRKAAREETWLAERYPEYAAYRRRARRFVPGVY